jgi:large subunit ribosomal protein L25
MPAPPVDRGWKDAMTAAQLPTLKAQTRNAAGKGAARRLRREGFVPAIAYGKGRPTTSIAVSPKEVTSVLKTELGRNSVVELDVSGQKMLAMIREYSVHPLARDLEHVDFIEVHLDKPVDVDVPLIPRGKAVGVTAGGVLRVVYRAVPVRCLPDKIPVKIEADVTHLELGMHVATKELKLPEGVVVRLPAEQTLIAVVAPEKEEVVEAVPGAAAAPGAVPAVAGAAPAAPGAAPAAGAPAAAPSEAAVGGKEDKKKK